MDIWICSITNENILVFLPALWYSAGTGMIRLNLYVVHPHKTAQTRQIKLDEKETQGKEPWVFFAFMEHFLGKNSRAEIKGKG